MKTLATDLSDIQIQASVFRQDLPAVNTKLKQHGVLVIPGVCDAASLSKLNEEFETAMNAETPYIRKVDYSNGRAVTIRMQDIEPAVYPATAELFKGDIYDRFTKLYLGRDDVSANNVVYVVNDVVGTKHHANDLHFDIQRSLKFFVYLTDTTVKNGAFSCVPGSHKITAEMRMRLGRKLSYENRELSRQLPVREEDAIAIEGAAGSLIIFDTDVFHRAGIVTEGERRVMRGQSNFLDALNYPGEQVKKSFWKNLFS
jgi:hypothetical protein